VILASHGHEAIQLAETESPDLIILDVRMPKLDGIATCVKLRSQERTGTIPIIAATAFRDVVGEAADAGADDIVIKPFHLTELLRRVRAMLRVRHVRDDVARVAAYVRELKASRPPGE
jgi:DNA-binding response OmpR family regulator